MCPPPSGMSTALTRTTVAMRCPMLGGVGAQLMAPLSPGATQTSTSCSTLYCLSRPGETCASGGRGDGLGWLKPRELGWAHKSTSGQWRPLVPLVMVFVGKGRGQLAALAPPFPHPLPPHPRLPDRRVLPPPQAGQHSRDRLGRAAPRDEDLQGVPAVPG